MPRADSKYYNKEVNRRNQKEWYERKKNHFGRIYKIINVLNGEFYIGSTTSDIKKRLYQHRTHARLNKPGLLYEAMRTHGPECFDVELIQECGPNDNPKHLESWYISDMGPQYNKNLKQY